MMDQFQSDSLVWRLVDGGVIQTRRERIATAALQGMLALNAHPAAAGYPDAAETAGHAIDYADALIAALDKEGE